MSKLNIKNNVSTEENSLSEQTFKIFIGCIPGKTLEKEVESIFSQFSSVTIHLERRKNNKCSGYGHLIVENKEDFDEILKGEHYLGDRKLSVLPYLEKKELIKSQLKFNQRRIVVAQLPQQTMD